MSAAVTKVADEDLSLMELGLFAREEFDKYRKWRRRAKKSAHKATAAIFRLGRWLSQAHTHLLNAGRGEWTAFLAENEIPRTTAWEAEELFRRAKTEDAVGGMTPTEAKRKFKVVPTKKKATSEPTVPSVKAGRVTAGSGIDSGTSMPMKARRPGELPPDPDRDRRQAEDAPPRPKPTPVVIPASTNQESEGVEADVSVPSGTAERDVEPATTAADQSPPVEKQSLLTIIVQIVRRLEVLVEDLHLLDLTTEPTDAIQREIDQCFVTLTKLKGGIAR